MSTFTNLLVHLVFGTKYRLPLITGALREPLYRYMGGIVRRQGCVLLEIGGMPDHVHLLVRIKADLTVAALVRTIKANASVWAKQQPAVQEAFAWQSGYGAFSVSESQVVKLRRYIRNQETHHRTSSFHDELEALLRRHRIAPGTR